MARMTQMEFDEKMRNLREEQRQKTLMLHQLHTMKVQERQVVKKQLDDIYTRNKDLGAEITAISQQIHEVNVIYGERKQNLNDEYYAQYVPKEFKPLDIQMAHRIRHNVLGALITALRGKCNVTEISFDFHFNDDGEVVFTTHIPELTDELPQHPHTD